MEDLIFIKPSLGFDEIGDGVIHVSIPKMDVLKVKGKLQVIEIPWIVTNKKETWPITDEEQSTRNTFCTRRPLFGGTKSRWTSNNLETFLTSENLVKLSISVYREIKDIIDNHIDLYEPGYADVVTCWIMGTYLFPAFSAYPYLFITGPRGSGKTKLLDVIGKLAFNAESTSNASPSSVFRLVESNQCTLLIDEAELLQYGKDSLELKLILNSGYKPNYPVVRTNPDSLSVERFQVYSPKAIASINPVDPTLRSRGIEIRMVKTNDKNRGTMRVDDDSAKWSEVRSDLYGYLLTYGLEIRAFYRHSKEIKTLNCRQNEIWSPLLAIALHSGDEIAFKTVADIALSTSTGDEVSIDDWSGALIRGLIDLAKSNLSYPISEIKTHMSNYLEADERDKVNSRWIGSALSKFGFHRGERRAKGVTYLIDPLKVLDLAKRYQLISNDDSALSVHSVDKTVPHDPFIDEAKAIFSN